MINERKMLSEIKRREPLYFLARMRAGLEARLRKIQERGGLYAKVSFSEWVEMEILSALYYGEADIADDISTASATVHLLFSRYVFDDEWCKLEGPSKEWKVE